MGMTIAGLLLDNEYIELMDIEEFLKIKLEEKRISTWFDCETGIDESDEIIVIFKNNSVLLYFAFDFFGEREKELKTLAMLSQRGLLFAGNETSMTFMLEWFEFRQQLGEDIYTFEGDFEVHGNNRLGLTEDSDIIIDGIFPFIQESLGGLNDDHPCKIYSFKLEDEEITKAPAQSNDLEKLKVHLRTITTDKQPEHGFEILNEMIAIISKNQKAVAEFAQIERGHLDKTFTNSLKKDIVKFISILKKRPFDKSDIKHWVMPVLFQLSKRPTVDLSDIKNGTFKVKRPWEFWK